MNNYPTQLDEIDQWLFDSFGIVAGACSSTENLRYNTAKMIAEALWPKCKDSLHIQETCKENGETFTDESNELDEEVTRYLREKCSADDEPSVSEIARHFANWQKEQDHYLCQQCDNDYDNVFFRGIQHAVEQMKKENKETIELAEDHAMLAGMVKKEEEMREKAIDGYVYESSNPVSEKPGARLHAISIIYDEPDGTPAILSGNKIKFYVFHDDKEE